MSNRGHLLLPFDVVRKLIGLPAEVEILDIRTLPSKEMVQIRLGSAAPVAGLTSDAPQHKLIDEIDQRTYARYLAVHYEELYSAMFQQIHSNLEEAPLHGEEG